MIVIRRFVSEEAWLAAIEADFLETLRTAAEDPLVLCLAGGTTPVPAYNRLAKALLHERRACEQPVLLVVGDERDGAIEKRYRNDEALKAAWDEALTAGSVSLIRWERSPTEPLAMERRLAEIAALRTAGRPLFDLCYLGLGADCHTAGIFPGDPMMDGIPSAEREGAAVPLTQRGRASDYPFERLSLSFAALLSSGRTRFLVRSAGKEPALAALASGDQSCPAVRAATADALAFVLD